MRFELEATLTGRVFHYTIAFEIPRGLKGIKVREEKLTLEGTNIYSRDGSRLRLAGNDSFTIDWNLVALPVIDNQSNQDDPISVLRRDA
jgi:hypothetical protein